MSEVDQRNGNLNLVYDILFFSEIKQFFGVINTSWDKYTMNLKIIIKPVSICLTKRTLAVIIYLMQNPTGYMKIKLSSLLGNRL